MAMTTKTPASLHGRRVRRLVICFICFSVWMGVLISSILSFRKPGFVCVCESVFAPYRIHQSIGLGDIELRRSTQYHTIPYHTTPHHNKPRCTIQNDTIPFNKKALGLDIGRARPLSCFPECEQFGHLQHAQRFPLSSERFRSFKCGHFKSCGAVGFGFCICNQRGCPGQVWICRYDRFQSASHRLDSRSNPDVIWDGCEGGGIFQSILGSSCENSWLKFCISLENARKRND